MKIRVALLRALCVSHLLTSACSGDGSKPAHGGASGEGSAAVGGATAGSSGAVGAGTAGFAAAGAVATGPGGKGSSPTAGNAAAGSGGTLGATSAPRPAELCTSPLAMADTSHPTTVIGKGAADGCNEDALRSALSTGGVISFDCGAAPVTISVSKTLQVPIDKDTTLDGNDLIVLDGGGTTQILRASSSNFRANDHVLTLQRLVMTRGHDQGSGFKARDGDKTCAWGYKSGGGGALNVRDLNVHIWGVTFTDNHGPELGPDVAGGALYITGTKKLIIASRTFTKNRAAKGGAIGILQTSTEIYNSVFENNQATGMLANFSNDTGCPTFNGDEQGGAGGLGGAYYADGQDPGDTFCGVRMADNTSGDLGGALFRSAYWGLIDGSPKQTMSWDQSTFENNHSPKGGGGAAYLNNSEFTLKRSKFIGNDSGADDGGGLKLTGLTLYADDVEFTDNTAAVGGGVADYDPGPDGAGTSSNIRFSGNEPNDTVGSFPK